MKEGMEWNGMEWNGMEWNGMDWNGMEWNGIKRKPTNLKENKFLTKEKFTPTQPIGHIHNNGSCCCNFQ